MNIEDVSDVITALMACGFNTVEEWARAGGQLLSLGGGGGPPAGVPRPWLGADCLLLQEEFVVVTRDRNLVWGAIKGGFSRARGGSGGVARRAVGGATASDGHEGAPGRAADGAGAGWGWGWGWERAGPSLRLSWGTAHMGTSPSPFRRRRACPGVPVMVWARTQAFLLPFQALQMRGTPAC